MRSETSVDGNPSDGSKFAAGVVPIHPIARGVASALWEVVRWGVTITVYTTLSALLLAALGWFSGFGSLVIGAAGGIVLGRFIPLKPPGGLSLWPLAVVVLVAGFVVFNGLLASEQLFGGRDDGTYINTAVSIAGSGGLPIDLEQQSTFPESARVDSPGFNSNGEGQLSPEFFHAYPALLAIGVSLAGVQAAGAINAVLGGLVLASFAVICLNRLKPSIATIATLGLALNLPFIYFSRAHFSEMLMMVSIFGGLALLDHARTLPVRRSTSLVCGIVIGSALAIRLDGFLLLIPLAAFVGLGRDTVLGLNVRWFVRGAIGVAGLGLLEVAVHSPEYLGAHAPQILTVLLLAALALAASRLSISRSTDRLRSLLTTHRWKIGAGVFGIVISVLIWGIWIRPECCPGLADRSNSWVSIAAAADGIQYDPGRSYVEMVPRSLVWYLGVGVVVAATVGLALSIRRLFAGDTRDLSVLAVATGFFGYLVRPSITADQMWASRRLLTVLIPVLLLLAAMMFDEISARLGRIKWMGSLLAAPVILWGFVVSSPLLDSHEYDGLRETFDEVCESIGERPVLIVENNGEPTGQFLSQPIRGLCRTPVASAHVQDLSGSDIEGDLVLVARSEATLGALDAQLNARPLFDKTFPIVEPTLTRPPSRTVDVKHQFYWSET